MVLRAPFFVQKDHNMDPEKPTIQQLTQIALNVGKKCEGWAKRNPVVAVTALVALAAVGIAYLTTRDEPDATPEPDLPLPRRHRLVAIAEMIVRCGTGYISLVNEAELVHAFVSEVRGGGQAMHLVTPELLTAIPYAERNMIVRLAAYARLQPEALDPEQIAEYEKLQCQLVTPQLAKAADRIRAKCC